MRIYVDVYDSTGTTKAGSGPILSVEQWQDTARLSRAGSFRFVCAAEDAAAAALAVFDVVICYGAENGRPRIVGRGIVQRISVQTDGPRAMLVVEGADLLRELAYRTVEALQISEAGYVTVGSVSHRDSLEQHADAAAAYDGNTGTSYSRDLVIGAGISNEFLYIRNETKFTELRITLGAAVNNNAATLVAQYSQGVTQSGNTVWGTLSVTSDGTAVSGATFAQTGVIEFAAPSDWVSVESNSETGYTVRLSATASTDIVDWAEVEVEVRVPTRTGPGLLQLKTLALPNSWLLDNINFYSLTVDTHFHQFTNETILEALVRLAEISGEHWRLGSPSVGTRTIQWMRGDTPDSGLRAIQDADPVTIHEHDDIALIASLREEEDAYEMVTRVYPYGSEVDGARVTLTNTTATPPSGYSLSASGNYLEKSSAVPAIHRAHTFEAGGDEIGEASAANRSDALYRAALAWLQQRDSTHTAYTLSLVGVAERPEVGETLRVIYRRVIDGYVALDIDADLVMLEVTRAIDSNGGESYDLLVSDITRRPDTDATILANAIKEQRR